MKTIWDYGVKYKYGYSKAYGGVHNGEDWTVTDRRTDIPVTVNGVTIGIAGTTGKSTGIHLHVGKYKLGVPFNPKGAGATFKNAVVTQIDRVGATNNGKYVRVQADGYSWVYLHLNSIPAGLTVGKVLKGDEDMYKGKTAKEWYDIAEGRAKRLRAGDKAARAALKAVEAVIKALGVKPK